MAFNGRWWKKWHTLATGASNRVCARVCMGGWVGIASAETCSRLFDTQFLLLLPLLFLYCSFLFLSCPLHSLSLSCLPLLSFALLFFLSYGCNSPLIPLVLPSPISTPGSAALSVASTCRPPFATTVRVAGPLPTRAEPLRRKSSRAGLAGHLPDHARRSQLAWAVLQSLRAAVATAEQTHAITAQSRG